MKHVGYCLSCYTEAGPISSVPIRSSRDDLANHLDREILINGGPLAEGEFMAIKADVLGDVELGWDSRLEYVLEGMNLPDGTTEFD